MKKILILIGLTIPASGSFAKTQAKMQSFLVEACYQDDFSRLLKNGISFLDLNSARNVLLDYCRRFMDEDTEKMRILSNTLDLKHSEDLLDTPTKNNLSERASGDLGSFLYGAIVADTVKRSIAELSVATTQVEMSSICIRKKREELYINELVPKLYLRNLPSSPQMYDFSENLRFYLESHKRTISEIVSSVTNNATEKVYLATWVEVMGSGGFIGIGSSKENACQAPENNWVSWVENYYKSGKDYPVKGQNQLEKYNAQMFKDTNGKVFNGKEAAGAAYICNQGSLYGKLSAPKKSDVLMASRSMKEDFKNIDQDIVATAAWTPSQLFSTRFSEWAKRRYSISDIDDLSQNEISGISKEWGFVEAPCMEDVSREASCRLGAFEGFSGSLEDLAFSLIDKYKGISSLYLEVKLALVKDELKTGYFKKDLIEERCSSSMQRNSIDHLNDFRIYVEKRALEKNARMSDRVNRLRYLAELTVNNQMKRDYEKSNLYMRKLIKAYKDYYFLKSSAEFAGGIKTFLKNSEDILKKFEDSADN